MKNYHIKLILTFYIITFIMILAMGLCTTLVLRGQEGFPMIKDRIAIITFLTILVLCMG